MAVKIRLKRIGAKKNPFYRVVVADSRYPRDGRFIEQLGTYNPLTDPAEVKIDGEKAAAWIKWRAADRYGKILIEEDRCNSVVLGRLASAGGAVDERTSRNNCAGSCRLPRRGVRE